EYPPVGRVEDRPMPGIARAIGHGAVQKYAFEWLDGSAMRFASGVRLRVWGRSREASSTADPRAPMVGLAGFQTSTATSMLRGVKVAGKSAMGRAQGRGQYHPSDALRAGPCQVSRERSGLARSNSDAHGRTGRISDLNSNVKAKLASKSAGDWLTLSTGAIIGDGKNIGETPASSEVAFHLRQLTALVTFASFARQQRGQRRDYSKLQGFRRSARLGRGHHIVLLRSMFSRRTFKIKVENAGKWCVVGSG
ncbi:hypothetical protein GGG16DRAFT_104276, partial [Schizophyllum commune]